MNLLGIQFLLAAQFGALVFIGLGVWKIANKGDK